jgi:hypothetical protein
MKSLLDLEIIGTEGRRAVVRTGWFARFLHVRRQQFLTAQKVLTKKAAG